MLNGNRTKSERKRSPRDFYQTPLDLATAAVAELDKDERIFDLPRLVCLDAGCGTGIWGQGMVLAYMESDGLTIPENYGIDLQPNVTLDPIPYMNVFTQDFLFHYPTFTAGYDVVFGNPPFSLAEEFVRHAHYLIGLNGYVFFLLRLSFLEGIKRCRGLYKDLPLKRVYVCSRRPSFFSNDTMPKQFANIMQAWDGEIIHATFYSMSMTAEQAAEEFRKFAWAWKCQQVLHPYGRGISRRRKQKGSEQ